jgi:ABC-type uncharacterized transport system permease subunit
MNDIRHNFVELTGRILINSMKNMVIYTCSGGDVLISIMSILLTVIFSALFIFGLIQCRKHSFTAGVYFFLILIVHKISPYFYSPFISKYIDSLTGSNTPPPMGMTFGELVAWFTLLPRILEVVAFSFLVVGLYRMWKSKTVKS